MRARMAIICGFANPRMAAMELVYLDNAATSWPKPPPVRAAMLRFLDEVGGNPGRSGHRLSIAAGRIVDSAREALAELFHAPDPLRIVFTKNATESLNLALGGLLRPGDHVVTSSMEHNSVMRPLRALAARGIDLTVVACARDGSLDASAVAAALRPATRLIALIHGSNVCGTLLPIAEVGAISRRAGILMLVDAAASAGCEAIDLEAAGIDLLAFTGHKSLYGPTGTGGLVIGDRVDPRRIEPLGRGGTGSRSDSEEQPDFLPDAFESGTLNAVGIAGLEAGVRWVLERGTDALRQHQVDLTRALIDGLCAIPRVTVCGTHDAHRQLGPVAFRVADLAPSDIGWRLDEEFGVLCRVGLHCAPAAHRTLGTFPDGAVRFSPGAFTTRIEIEMALRAVTEIARSAKGSRP
jgi:cysteine desulfurase / selenocysteine lyase